MNIFCHNCFWDYYILYDVFFFFTTLSNICTSTYWTFFRIQLYLFVSCIWLFPLWKTFHNGKSHIATGLVIKACLAGYKVMFATVPLLINRLKESRSEKTLQLFESRFEKYDLVIADELCKALHNSSYVKLNIM